MYVCKHIYRVKSNECRRLRRLTKNYTSQYFIEHEIFPLLLYNTKVYRLLKRKIPAEFPFLLITHQIFFGCSYYFTTHFTWCSTTSTTHHTSLRTLIFLLTRVFYFIRSKFSLNLFNLKKMKSIFL